MAEVVSIKFRNRGKTYFFDPAGIAVHDGELVVVETSKGLELGDAVQGNHEVEDEKIVQPLRPVVRIATDDDRRIEELCRKREKEAFAICRQKIEEHGLDMKLVDVECSFEGNKILFFFSSEGRVDFRELVRDLAGVFRTRIELRQIGVRDEARMLGGLGICGRPFCCGAFLDDFQPVSTKMAKTQSMSLNPAKISGACGRLMCCLRYEQEAYEELVKSVPKNGAFVETPDGYGNVVQVNVLRQDVKVKMDGTGEDVIKGYAADEVAAVPGGRPRDGSAPAHILQLKPKAEKKPEESEDDWQMPQMLPAEPGREDKAKETVRPKKRSFSQRQFPGKEGAGIQQAAPGTGSQTGGKSKPPRSTGQPQPYRPRPDRQPQKSQPNGQPGTGQERTRNTNQRHRLHTRSKPKTDEGAPKPKTDEGTPKQEA
jgi:cell fate regulator YaaT (PSP1 superfamily)